MMEALTEKAISRARARASESVGEETGYRGSNLGGFQDIIDAEDQLAAPLRDAFMFCMQRAAAADAAEVLAGGDMTSPPSPRCPPSGTAGAAWMNVSGKGALNILHNHGTSAYAAVAYGQVPGGSSPDASGVPCGHDLQAGRNDGALLLRLSRGSGARFMEPDEDVHVPRLFALRPEESEAVSTESDDDAVQYLQIHPREGSILIFPAWIPHSVSPHFEELERVCFASNYG